MGGHGRRPPSSRGLHEQAEGVAVGKTCRRSRRADPVCRSRHTWALEQRRHVVSVSGGLIEPRVDQTVERNRPAAADALDEHPGLAQVARANPHRPLAAIAVASGQPAGRGHCDSLLASLLRVRVGDRSIRLWTDSGHVWTLSHCSRYRLLRTPQTAPAGSCAYIVKRAGGGKTLPPSGFGACATLWHERELLGEPRVEFCL